MGLRGAAGGLMLLGALVVAAAVAVGGVIVLRDRLPGDDEQADVASIAIPPFTAPIGDRSVEVPVERIPRPLRRVWDKLESAARPGR